MAEFAERRGERAVLMGPLVLVFGFAAWRGWAHARGVAIVMLALVAAALVYAVVSLFRPLSSLQVAAEAITWTRGTDRQIVFRREDSDAVHFHRAETRRAAAPWQLVRPGSRDGMDLFGYKVEPIRDALTSMGWQVTMKSVRSTSHRRSTRTDQ